MLNTHDEVAIVSNIHKTTNYTQFNLLPGNRRLDKSHVRELSRRMQDNNLTQYFPILVNEKMEIIDGQHRLRALEELKYPVYYEIKEGLTIDSTIAFNSGTRNWTWKDYAQSYADRGDKNYEQFLQLYEEFKQRYSILYIYCTGMDRHGRNKAGNSFNDGDFVMKNYELSHQLLMQYTELAALSGVESREFAAAAYRFMRSPYYKQDKMLEKLEAKGGMLRDCYFVNDFLTALEDIWKS